MFQDVFWGGLSYSKGYISTLVYIFFKTAVKRLLDGIVKKNQEIFGGVAFLECRLSPVVNTEYHTAISMTIFIFLSPKY